MAGLAALPTPAQQPLLHGATGSLASPTSLTVSAVLCCAAPAPLPPPLNSPPLPTSPPGFTVPNSELFSTITIAPLTEPVRLLSVTIPIVSTTQGWFEVWVVSNTENFPSQFTPVRLDIPADITAPQDIVITLGPFGLELGNRWGGSIQIFARPGQQITDFAPPPGQPLTLTCDASAQPPPLCCFSPAVGTELAVSLSIARGGALGYISAMSGTSMSAPLLAGLAATVRGYYMEGWLATGAPVAANTITPSAALLKATLINSATALLDQPYYDLFNLPRLLRWQEMAQGGHGVPSLVRGLYFNSLGSLTAAAGQLPVLLVPSQRSSTEEASLGPGSQDEYCIATNPVAAAVAAGTVIPLSITLVWTDPPSAPNAASNLVNDLDLVVIAPPPSSVTAYGNACTQAQVVGQHSFSCTGVATTPGQVPDTVNNVEVLTFYSPGAATFKVFVRASRVVVGATQAYSLVVTGPGIVQSAPVGGVCP
jgi:hypothetical protein